MFPYFFCLFAFLFVHLLVVLPIGSPCVWFVVCLSAAVWLLAAVCLLPFAFYLCFIYFLAFVHCWFFLFVFLFVCVCFVVCFFLFWRFHPLKGKDFCERRAIAQAIASLIKQYSLKRNKLLCICIAGTDKVPL